MGLWRSSGLLGLHCFRNITKMNLKLKSKVHQLWHVFFLLFCKRCTKCTSKRESFTVAQHMLIWSLQFTFYLCIHTELISALNIIQWECRRARYSPLWPLRLKNFIILYHFCQIYVLVSFNIETSALCMTTAALRC